VGEPEVDESGGTSTYITCMADPDTAFFGCGPGGFLILDGVRKPLVSGTSTASATPRSGS
jgi:hypothetical protein